MTMVPWGDFGSWMRKKFFWVSPSFVEGVDRNSFEAPYGDFQVVDPPQRGRG